MGIQLFKAKYEVEECLAEIKECLEVGWTGMGFKTVKFEEAWKAYTGLPFAHYSDYFCFFQSRYFKIQYETGFCRY